MNICILQRFSASKKGWTMAAGCQFQRLQLVGNRCCNSRPVLFNVLTLKEEALKHWPENKNTYSIHLWTTEWVCTPLGLPFSRVFRIFSRSASGFLGWSSSLRTWLSKNSTETDRYSKAQIVCAWSQSSSHLFGMMDVARDFSAYSCPLAIF